MGGAEQTPSPDDILIPPCVARYRFNMNIGGSLVFDDMPGTDGQKQTYTTCKGGLDPWCEGGYIAGGPDGTPLQTEFTLAMGRICTARCWYKRNNGLTTSVERLDIQDGS